MASQRRVPGPFGLMPRRKPATSRSRATAVAAANRVDAARKELSAARANLAASTLASDATGYLGPEWEHYRPLIEKSHLLHRIPGVVGTSIGRRIRRGVPFDDKPVVTVFVREKVRPARRIPASQKIPKSIRLPGGGGLDTDVVELGEFHDAVAAGAAIGAQASGDTATLSFFANDRELNKPVALTVMHLITNAGIPPRTDLRFVSPAVDGAVLPVGTYLRGTLTRADAMAILLDAGVPHQNNIPGIGAIVGSRPLVDPGDRFIAVRMHGAASGRRRVGRVENCSVSLPDLGLDAAVLVAIEVEPGDSGAVIVDNDGFALGILKGFFDGGDRLAVFSPIGAVLGGLRCSIP